MSRHHHEYLDVYCCLPHEFLRAYPQPRSIFYDQVTRKDKYRNTNALERTSSSRLSEYKPKNLLYPYKRSKDHYANQPHTSRRRMISKIMSIESSNHKVKFDMKKEFSEYYDSLQMADGDKKTENISENVLDQFQQQRFTDNEEQAINMMHDDIIRLVPCQLSVDNRLKQSSSFKNPISHRSSTRIDQSLNRISTWRKLQANITATQYDHIQQFQRERQQEQHHSLLSVPRPIMLSPLTKQSETENSEITKTISEIINSSTSSGPLSSDSSAESNSNHRIVQSINVGQLLSDDNSNGTIPVTNSLREIRQSEISKENIITEEDSLTSISVPNSLETPSLHDIKNIEEFQPMIEVISTSQVPPVLLNDIFSSFFPTVSIPLASISSSHSNPLAFHSEHHTDENISKTPYILFDKTSNMTELVFIDQPSTLTSSFIESNLISEQHQPRKVHSLPENIEELCLLVRKLLHHELTGQTISSLQATIASQLAILLTYLAIPNNEKIISELRTKNIREKMTSTEEDLVSFPKSLLLTIGTQTDFEWNVRLNDPISESMIMSSENIHFQTNVAHDLIDFKVHKSSPSEDKEMIDISHSPQKGTSHTESISTSVTLHLPGRRLNHALSDTFLYHVHHRQQYSSSHYQLISLSETILHSLMPRSATMEKTKHLLQRVGQKLQYFIELESSNTCLEASTEFTPDFLLTTNNHSKYDDEGDDQTEQFGIDTEKQDYQTDIIPLIINKNQDKIDTLTFNSTEKENCDSLELDMEKDNDEHLLFNSSDIQQSNQHSNNHLNTEKDAMPRSSITESNSLSLNNSSSLSLNHNHISPIIYQPNKENYLCEVFEPLLKSYQWQVPILPRKVNSIHSIYEKQTAKIDFKYLKIRSNSNNRINLVGKQIRIRSNPSSRPSTPTIKSHSNQEQSNRLSALNYNNNCFESDHSSQSRKLSSTSNDSLYSFDGDTLDKNNTNQCTSLLLVGHIESGRQTESTSSHLSDITNKLDSNIVVAETLLNMLNTLNDNHNTPTSTVRIDALHMYIRQFLIEFDARVHLGRKRRREH